MLKKINFLFVAVVLGLGWAMRGQFGHEWGASWAGAMGALAVLLVAKQKNWNSRAPVLVALGAIGWGVGGMMSYGIVVGYCRSVSFINSLYGYAMLTVIGGLYGFIGGGLFGLGLETSETNKPKWTNLISEMFVGGFLVWGLLIYQMEWFMTPPRSELWAGCLGAAIALGWFLYRNNFKKALRVAAYSALGAGFGFFFGNFIQIVGNTAGVQYNWWNVMEFTLGFFGGLGMVYAVLTREWKEIAKPSKAWNWIAIVFVFLFIPVANYFNGFTMDHFIQLAENLNIPDTEHYAGKQFLSGGISLLIVIFLAIITWKYCSAGDGKTERSCVPFLLLITAVHYNFFCYIKLGIFFRPFSFRYSYSLYIFIILLLSGAWYFGLRKVSDMPMRHARDETWKRWGIILISLLAIIMIITAISVNIHDELPGAHNRF